MAGVFGGAAGIADQWTVPLEDTVRSAVFGFDGVRISELAERTLRLTEQEA
ncbi:ADP-ribosylglycohydrolase OS=Streptomyces violarus OX=67380 GN=FHS41_001297 PE=4 SV=1 [Streptomyces violarus]